MMSKAPSETAKAFINGAHHNILYGSTDAGVTGKMVALTELTSCYNSLELLVCCSIYGYLIYVKASVAPVIRGFLRKMRLQSKIMWFFLRSGAEQS